ncbi:hypothetical protein Pcinc_036962 [Petrolisthes cinctipes]|uniref:Uncharacterized protein n=1 Tax=Petrolisthes cinctipes TaxID=88211 RepID=A0AAE1BV06_PETCI|nr:hypothetical protein Pcinc_036962 [Petrolisthes cinctipes]
MSRPPAVPGPHYTFLWADRELDATCLPCCLHLLQHLPTTASHKSEVKEGGKERELTVDPGLTKLWDDPLSERNHFVNMGGDGVVGDGVVDDGVVGDGVVGDGVVSDGVVGGVVDDGVVGDEVVGDGDVCDGVVGDGVVGDGDVCDGVVGDGVVGDGVVGDEVVGDGVVGNVKTILDGRDWCGKFCSI